MKGWIHSRGEGIEREIGQVKSGQVKPSEAK